MSFYPDALWQATSHRGFMPSPSWNAIAGPVDR